MQPIEAGGHSFPTAQGEAKYLLDRWLFSVSTTGLLWIQPTRPTVSPEEIAGLLAILAGACDNEYPQTLKFELGETRILGEQWTVVESLLVDFAHSIGGQVRLIAGIGRPAAAIMICRRQSN